MSSLALVSGARRGNALLMVSALLVMLTLVAAAFLSRARTQRLTASIFQESSRSSARGEKVARDVASEIARHLFVRPVDPSGAALVVGGDSAGNRLPPPEDAVRFGIESAPPRSNTTFELPADRLNNTLDPRNTTVGTSQDYRLTEPGAARSVAIGSDGWPDGFNFPPYAVIPWTNWPDFRRMVANSNAGTPWWQGSVAAGTTPPGMPGDVYGNPLGNPGFGDTRWLRNTEPVRGHNVGTASALSLVPNPNGAFFSHWPHLSWLPTPNNGFRVVPDIGDIDGHTRSSGEQDGSKFVIKTGDGSNADFFGGSMGGSNSSNRDGFGTPYEQWPAHIAPSPIAVSASEPDGEDDAWVREFTARRNRWFTRDGYQSVLLDSTSETTVAQGLLPNFIRLDDPLGIGRTVNPDADPVPPADEAIGDPSPRPRNIVARTFCDADGDGYTDSFWYLAPAGTERNLRTVVGISVVDNAGMTDLNVATRFDRRTTVGFTPADLALVSSEPEGARFQKPAGQDPDNTTHSLAGRTDTRVGLFDQVRNHMSGAWDPVDPRANRGGNPSGLVTDLARPIYSRNEASQIFDPYRWAGLPNHLEPRVARGGDLDMDDRSEDGEGYLLKALGLRPMDLGSNDAQRRAYWSPLFYRVPGGELAQVEADNGPRFDLLGPGSPVRPQQRDPMLQRSGRWRSWLPDQPLVRGQERTRWFQSALQGEARFFAPFAFGVSGNKLVQANEIYPSAGPSPVGTRDIRGRPFPITPFDLSDEIELRRFAGLNDARTMSRLERSLNGDDLVRSSSDLNKVTDSILRSSVLRNEGGTGGSGLTNAQLVRDMRRKVTVASGQANDLMPPWLWIGRPYLRWDGFDNLVSNQNATLWLGLHPEAPGARDENNDGRIDGEELQWGTFDLQRISTNSDSNLDGAGMTPTSIDERDRRASIARFEWMNRKLDLRQPLLMTLRVAGASGSTVDPAAVHDVKGQAFEYHSSLGPSAAIPAGSDRVIRDPESLQPRVRYAYTAAEERRAALEFARDVRQRLRPALRTHSLQRNQLDWLGNITGKATLPVIELLGPTAGLTSTGLRPVLYAGYTDRFPDQLRLGLDAKVRMTADPTVLAGANQLSIIGAGSIFDARDLLPWRSAWSTEAMTASLAANITTWRSPATLVNEEYVSPLAAQARYLLRGIHQPILPGFPTTFGFGAGQPTTPWDYEPRQFFNNVAQEQHPLEPAPSAAIRAVDPAMPANQLPNADQPAQEADWDQPGEDTANLVFPGVEKHPFLTECFFSWVYPATTAENTTTGTLEHAVMKVQGDPTAGGACADVLPAAQDGQRFVALVNGRVGPEVAGRVPVQLDDPGAGARDFKRDQLHEIRTPVLVVQVANPWNEPIRLCDFALDIFGTRYEFPPFELDQNGVVRVDADGRPVPLVLNPSTERQPATATVYLIARSLGNPSNSSGFTSSSVPTGAQADLSEVALWDPFFRRRWLDYFDLFEFEDRPNADLIPPTAFQPGGAPVTTSPNAWSMYGHTSANLDGSVSDGTRLPECKLLNAMDDPDFADEGKLRIFKRGLDANKLRRGITLLRRLRNPGFTPGPTGVPELAGQPLARKQVVFGIDPADVSANPQPRWYFPGGNPSQNLSETVLEVDRFDADGDFDHFSTTVGGPSSGSGWVADARNPSGDIAMYRDPRTNFDTNLVTGGRFWSACAKITLPPRKWRDPVTPTKIRDLPRQLGSVVDLADTVATNDALPASVDVASEQEVGSPLTFDEPAGDERSFPPPTAKQLVRIESNPIQCCTSPPGPCPDLPDLSATAPAGFPGILLGKHSQPTKAKDYFVTWTRVARTWSRTFSARWTTSAAPRLLHPAAGVPSTAPSPEAQANLPVWSWTRQLVRGSFQSGDRSGWVPASGMAPRFVFAARSEPDSLLDPVLVSLSDADLKSVMPGLPARYELVSYAISSDPVEANRGRLIDRQALGDTFRAGKTTFDDDPDGWTPSLSDPTWLADPSTFNWLTRPVWAPLPDFQMSPPDTTGSISALNTNAWPELILRKPTAFNNYTVVDPRVPPAGDNRLVAYYGRVDQAAGTSKNTLFRVPAWARRRSPGAAPPYASVPYDDSDLSSVEQAPNPDQYPRIYMADKGGRVIDHDGRLLPLDPIRARPLQLSGQPLHVLNHQGLWNTLDRYMHQGSLQMLQKDDDFEQLGELMDVFLWGPAYRMANPNVNAPYYQPPPPRPPISQLSGRLLATGWPDPDGPLEEKGAIEKDSDDDKIRPPQLISQCRATFSEIMTGRVPGFPVGEGPMVNRLQVDAPGFAFAPSGPRTNTSSASGGASNVWQFAGTSALRTPYAPSIPWGMRVFDCFTLDGPGAAPRYDWSDSTAGTGVSPRLFETGGAESGVLPLDDELNWTQPPPTMARKDAATGRPVGALIPASVPPNGLGRITRTMLAQWESDGSPRLSGGFGSLPVRGLLNLNTAPIEVLKTMPHMSQLVYDDSGRVMGGNGIPVGAPLPGPSPVDSARTNQGFDLGLAPDAGLSGNPTVLLAEAIDIYRNQMNPGRADANGGWRQARMDPLVPETNRSAAAAANNLYPAAPSYQDRGAAVPLSYTLGMGSPAWLPPVQGSSVATFASLNRFDFTKLPTDYGLFVPTVSNGQPGTPLSSGVAPQRGMRGQRGFESVGEVAGMGRSAAKQLFDTEFPDWQFDKGWSARMAGMDPFRYSFNTDDLGMDAFAQGWFADFNPLNPLAPRLRDRIRNQEPLDARLSTDRQGVRRFEFSVGGRTPDAYTLQPDDTFGDSEEQHLLFKGISNLITTRSDVFTVYLRVRTVRQDPLTGGWNGVDPDSIVEDVRYVMGVDRSNVRRPSDPPRITYLERVED